jgi:hypothetical protein
LPTDALNDYVGSYNAPGGLSVVISRDGSGITSSARLARVSPSASRDMETRSKRPMAKKTVPLQAEVRDVFFTPGSPRIRIIFQRNAGGRVAGYLKRHDERDLLFTKG